LDDPGHQGFEYRPIVGCRKRIKEAVQIAITRGEPVKKVHTTKHCLCSFDEENSVNYMRTVRRPKGEVQGRLLAEQLRGLPVVRKIVAIHDFIVR
jgi:hypothetical protein